MRYSEAQHDSPGPDCQCGYRVVESLPTLQRYLNDT